MGKDTISGLCLGGKFKLLIRTSKFQNIARLVPLRFTFFPYIIILLCSWYMPIYIYRPEYRSATAA